MLSIFYYCFFVFYVFNNLLVYGNHLPECGIVTDSYGCIAPCDTSPCNCNGDCQNCHDCHSNGCDQCENGSFKINPDYPCVNCKERYGDECLHCNEGVGCAQCESHCSHVQNSCGLWECDCPVQEPTAQTPAPQPSGCLHDHKCADEPCDCYDNNFNCAIEQCHNYGCDQCADGFWKLDFNHKCISCDTVFGNDCLTCGDWTGCTQCRAGCTQVWNGCYNECYCPPTLVPVPTTPPVVAPVQPPTVDCFPDTTCNNVPCSCNEINLNCKDGQCHPNGCNQCKDDYWKLDYNHKCIQCDHSNGCNFCQDFNGCGQCQDHCTREFNGCFYYCNCPPTPVPIPVTTPPVEAPVSQPPSCLEEYLCDDSPCDCSNNLNCEDNPNKCYNHGCDKCKPGYWALNFNHECIACDVLFDNDCLSCANWIGCDICRDGCTKEWNGCYHECNCSPTPQPVTIPPPPPSTNHPTGPPTPDCFPDASCYNEPCKCNEMDLHCKDGTCHSNGCDQCEDGYWALNHNHKCVSCDSMFGDNCLFCQDIHGCGQCKDHCVREFNGCFYKCNCSPTPVPVPPPPPSPPSPVSQPTSCLSDHKCNDEPCDCNENIHCQSGECFNHGCNLCEDGYWALDFNHECISCNLLFDDDCLSCSNWNGCNECRIGCTKIWNGCYHECYCPPTQVPVPTTPPVLAPVQPPTVDCFPDTTCNNVPCSCNEINLNCENGQCHPNGCNQCKDDYWKLDYNHKCIQCDHSNGCIFCQDFNGCGQCQPDCTLITSNGCYNYCSCPP
jgi:hypothetical protein